MNLYDYKRTLKQAGTTEGQVKKHLSDIVMEETWNRDLQSRKAYLYDYYHDDQKDLGKGMIYSSNTHKTPIDIKFIVTQYATLAKDQIEYHVMFRPSENFDSPSYFNEYEQKFGNEVPVGLYLDIPDDQGVYHKWLICSKEIANQFVKYSVLPCNYYFHWIYKNKRYDMWGVVRLRSSYNSGVWTNYLLTEPENQDQIWLPMNDISKLIYYDQRMIISSAALERPLTWQVSKVENIHPFGINKLTVSQCKFDPDTDKKVDGWWYADYSKEKIEPIYEPAIIPPGLQLSWVGANPNIKIGGSPKKYVANNKVGNISWEFEIDGQNISNMLDVTIQEDYCLIQTDNEDLVNKTMLIRVTQEDGLLTELNVGFTYL